MLNEIKKYQAYELMQIKDNLSEANKKLLKDFLLYCGTTAGKAKLRNIERVMIKVADIFQKDLNKINLEDLRQFLNLLKNADLMPPTKNEFKKHLKRFIKENYPDWNTRFKGLKDFKLEKEVNREKINSNTLLSVPDIERLMRATDSIRDKTMICLLYETACRPEEALKLKWRDVNLDKGNIKLSSSKTGETRELPLVDSLPHLIRLKKEYSYLDINQDDFIFVSPKSRTKHLTIIWLDAILRKAGQVAFNSEKLIYPYIIRHSRLKVLQKKLPAILYEKFAGHSIDTAKQFYEHMDNEDLRESLMSNVYNIQELTENERNDLQKQLREQGQKLDQLKEILSLYEQMGKFQIKQLLGEKLNKAEMQGLINIYNKVSGEKGEAVLI